MRQIAFDTETTGLSTEQGHRIIEVGCIEIINRRITNNHFHFYINPDREVDPGAFSVHGISTEFLSDKQRFAEIFEQLLQFIEGAELIIHNAPFDVGFLNYEFSLLGHPRNVADYCTVFDTLPFARQRHPGQKNSLDALCKRYEIDNSHRQLHGALLDADLLARLYLNMTGGQGSLFAEEKVISDQSRGDVLRQLIRNKPLPVMTVSEEELQVHQEFVELLHKCSGINLWDVD